MLPEKYYFYDIIINDRPDGSAPKFEQGVLNVPFWWSTRRAFDHACETVRVQYEVLYAFHFKEFRRIK